jgi:Rrf2 family transcriptional regulator, cysteine metabolism repressor
MKLSTKGDYATRVILELALNDDEEALSVHELSTRTGLPAKYLEQIMVRLKGARLVRSERGAHGGYALAREADDLTVGEVVRVMEGPLAPSPCASKSVHVACPTYRCPTEETCVLRGLWLDVRDAIAGVVDRTTFADLAERQRSSSVREMYVI